MLYGVHQITCVCIQLPGWGERVLTLACGRAGVGWRDALAFLFHTKKPAWGGGACRFRPRTSNSWQGHAWKEAVSMQELFI